MITAKDPIDNAEKFFKRWGERIRGTGDNRLAFVNALLGRDVRGQPVRGQLSYNPNPDVWRKKVLDSIAYMQRVIQNYMNDPGH